MNEKERNQMNALELTNLRSIAGGVNTSIVARLKYLNMHRIDQLLADPNYHESEN